MSKEKQFFRLEYRYGTSRGADTYGYTTCSLKVDGKRESLQAGGGYDMQGAALGVWMSKAFQTELKKLPANYGSGDNAKGFYGLIHWDKITNERVTRANKNTKTYCDGACGLRSMESILDAMGLERVSVTKDALIVQTKDRS